MFNGLFNLGDYVVIMDIEYNLVLCLLRYLCDNYGVKVIFVLCDVVGRVFIDYIWDLIESFIKLIVVSYVSNVIGVI